MDCSKFSSALLDNDGFIYTWGNMKKGSLG